MEAPRYFVRGITFQATDPALQDALARVYDSAERPRCMCVRGGVEMYIAKHGEYVVKRMPGTGDMHHPTCQSFEPEPGISGLGELVGEAIVEHNADHVEIRTDFPFSRVSVKAMPRGEANGEPPAVNAPRKRMSLRAVLHFLYHRAGLNRWYPAMEGRRSQGVIKKYLELAASGVTLKGETLNKRLYVPEPFRVADKEEIGERRRRKLAMLLSPGDDVAYKMAIVIGQFNGAEQSAYGRRLPIPVVDELWDRITTDRQGCSGSKCPEFSRCPFQAARQRVKEADLVIANHDLVLSAIDMEGASVLPAAQGTIYVFDEAHSLAAKAVEHFSARHAIRGAVEWLEGACNAVRDAVLGLRLDEQLIGDSRASSERIESALRELHRCIHGTNGFEEKRARRFKSGVLPAWCHGAGEQILDAGEGLQKTFASLREHVLERATSAGTLATQILSVLGFYVVRLDNLVDTWQLMLAEQPDGAAPIARWIERHDEGGQPGDYMVCASPISGSDKLRKLLWNRASGAVVMSATLTSCGTFDLFLRQSGLGYFERPTFLQVDSPFDFRRQARLVVPAMRAEPTAAEQHTQEVGDRLPALVDTPGTLVLFTSARQMRDVYALLPEDLRRITLVQGSMPKGEMLARHRAAVDRLDRSVLFGLSTFAEGVDLPGDYCTHVVIVKLPFSVPDSPLEEARREWVESRGGSRPC